MFFARFANVLCINPRFLFILLHLTPINSLQNIEVKVGLGIGLGHFSLMQKVDLLPFSCFR